MHQEIVIVFYSDCRLLKAVTDSAESMGNFAGLGRRICLGPNTLKKGVIGCFSIVYRVFGKRVGTFSKKGRDFFENG